MLNLLWIRYTSNYSNKIFWTPSPLSFFKQIIEDYSYKLYISVYSLGNQDVMSCVLAFCDYEIYQTSFGKKIKIPRFYFIFWGQIELAFVAVSS